MSSRMLCTCWRYCQGGKRVSRTTYREHAPICAAEEQAAAQMRGPQVASGSGGGPAGRSDSESSSGDDEDSDSSSAASERLERRRKRPLSPVNEAWPAATQREDNNDIDMESGHDPPSPHDPPPQHGPDTRHQDEPQVQDEPELQEQEPPEQHNSQSEEDLDRGDGVHPEILSSRLEDLQLGLDYIELVKSATLDNDDLPEDIKAALRDAPEGLPSIDDPDLRHSLDVFLALKDCSEETYELVREANLRRNPDNEILSFHLAKKKIAELTGVVSLTDPMCVNSCMAYTGPLADHDTCLVCKTPRVDEDGRSTTRPFQTYPLGPQMQAMYRNPKMAREMHVRVEETEWILAMLDPDMSMPEDFKLTDILCAREYLDAVKDGRIAETDFVVMGSMDGAQLYRDKKSDCWISIWIIVDICPEKRYKKMYILPDFIIGGPENPKVIESFLYRSTHHLSALMKEGLSIWDAHRRRKFLSFPFLFLKLADGPGCSHMNGLCGHHGAYGCRLYCILLGRHKEGGRGYYAMTQKPLNYTVSGCDHDDVDPRTLNVAPAAKEAEYQRNLKYLLESRNQSQFQQRRKATGIAKPSIFSGLPRERTLGIPGMFATDLMHFASLNWTDLMFALLSGSIPCDPRDSKELWAWFVWKGEAWALLGELVVRAAKYFPGSFGRVPRNPVEKISSGYKAWEWLLLLVGMGPALLYGVLPDDFWRHFCKGVAVLRCFHQREMTVEQVRRHTTYSIEYAEDFETLYVQRMEARMHFVRQSIHGFPHFGPEAIRVGPQPYYAQWAMERTIGNLVEELRLPSNPFAHLAQRALLRAQVNALLAMFPELDTTSEKESKIPRGALQLRGKLVLLGTKDSTNYSPPEDEAAAVRAHFGKGQNTAVRFARWARMRLPNGQIVRSTWREKIKVGPIRISSNVKAMFEGKTVIAQIQYFFLAGEREALAVAALYEPPKRELLEKSYGTLWVSRGIQRMVVLRDVDILTVVAMVPHTVDGEDAFYLVEKPGLDVSRMGGFNDPEEINEGEENT